MSDYSKLFEAILAGDADTAHSLTAEALANNIDPQELVMKFMVPAMDEVGRRFECSEYYIPELLISARAMSRAMDLVRPVLAACGAEPVGRVAIGTVQGDLHDIGKNLVASMLEGGGFEVVDLGVDVPPDSFVSSVQEKSIDIVAISALLTTTMPSMKSVLDGLQASGLREKVKVLVGGAPITQRYADQIGADGYSETAVGAVPLARELIGASGQV